jgi:hypothetical protein
MAIVRNLTHAVAIFTIRIVVWTVIAMKNWTEVNLAEQSRAHLRGDLHNG